MERLKWQELDNYMWALWVLGFVDVDDVEWTVYDLKICANRINDRYERYDMD